MIKFTEQETFRIKSGLQQLINHKDSDANDRDMLLDIMEKVVRLTDYKDK
jgi:hypothetical protein